MCVCVVDLNKELLVVSEVVMVSDLSRCAVKVYGCAATTRLSDGKKYLVVLSEFCEDGCLEDFVMWEWVSGCVLSEWVKLDLFL